MDAMRAAVEESNAEAEHAAWMAKSQQDVDGTDSPRSQPGIASSEHGSEAGSERSADEGSVVTSVQSSADSDQAALAAEPTPTVLYSLAELRGGCPLGVSPQRKEASLSEDGYQEAFGMDKAGFDAMAKWKRDSAKKKAGLY